MKIANSIAAISFIALSIPALAQNDEGFEYDWNDPEAMDANARAERDRFEDDFEGIVIREKEKRRIAREEAKAEHARRVAARQREVDARRGSVGTGILQGLGIATDRIRAEQRRQETERRRQARAQNAEALRRTRASIAANERRREREQRRRARASARASSASSSSTRDMRIISRSDGSAERSRRDAEAFAAGQREQERLDRAAREKRAEAERERERKSAQRRADAVAENRAYCAKQGKTWRDPSQQTSSSSSSARVVREDIVCE